MNNQIRREFLEATIRQAGSILMEHFGHVIVDHIKDGGAHDVVTIADIETNTYITKQIKQHFPGDMIVSEEDPSSHGNTGAERVWIIDPLDGTKNFASRVPLFGVLMAYAEAGEVVLSAIYLPTTNELLIAEKDRGATINNAPLCTSELTNFASSYGTGPVKLGRETMVRFVQALKTTYGDAGPWMNGFACIAIAAAYVADGRRDWYATRGTSKVWDYAAPSLIMKEAGCVVTDEHGQPWKIGDTSLVAANPHLHPEILRLMQWKP